MKVIWVILALVAGVFAETSDGEADQRVFGKSEEESYRGKVVLIRVGEKDLMNEQAFKFMRRTLRRVNEEDAAAVVFDLKTPGGYAAYTAELMMTEMAELKVPSYAFVNNEATSAGALIAVATDAIYMKPVSAIGSAALVRGDGQEIPKTMQAKLDSAYGSFTRSVVRKKGHNEDVVRAMMFTDETFSFDGLKGPEGEELDIWIGSDELLNLTGEEAVMEYEGKPLLAKGLVDSVDELLDAEGLGGRELVKAEMTPFERFAYWIKFVGPVLILVGLGAGYFEMKTPGFGIGGAIALLAFAVFFFGNYAAGNLAGYELAAIFVVGLLLILVDLFLFPGTFVMGFTGVALMLGSLMFAMVDRFDYEDVTEGAFSVNWWDVISYPAAGVSAGLLGSILAMSLMMKYLPKVPFVNRYFLPGALAEGAGFVVDGEEEEESRVGWTGEAVTDLKPSGKAVFQGEEIDVTAEDSFLAAGEQVRIVSEDAMRVVVRKV